MKSTLSLLFSFLFLISPVHAAFESK